MSRWYDVILAVSSLENIAGELPSGEDAPPNYPGVDYVNSWLTVEHGRGLNLIGSDDPKRHNVSHCFSGSYNHLHIEGLLRAVLNAPWEWDKCVQLLVKDEDDLCFTSLHPYPAVPNEHLLRLAGLTTAN